MKLAVGFLLALTVITIFTQGIWAETTPPTTDIVHETTGHDVQQTTAHEPETPRVTDATTAPESTHGPEVTQEVTHAHTTAGAWVEWSTSVGSESITRPTYLVLVLAASLGLVVRLL